MGDTDNLASKMLALHKADPNLILFVVPSLMEVIPEYKVRNNPWEQPVWQKQKKKKKQKHTPKQ